MVGKRARGRAPCCDKTKVKKGCWSPSEDQKLTSFIQRNGHNNWRALPRLAGLLRCGKSCRLRWVNYLRPDIKRGNYSRDEEDTIIRLHKSFGNKWSKIAAKLPGRTDNEIKNIWHTYLKKRLEGGNDQSGYSPNSSPECCISAAAMVGTPAANNDHLKQEGIIVSSVAPVNVEPIKKEDSKSGQGMIVPSAAAAAEDLHDFESIPFDSDDDIWDLLDSLNTIADSDQFPPEEVLPLPPIPNELPKPEMKNIESGGEAAAARAESYKKWLKYLEIELGLDDDKDN